MRLILTLIITVCCLQTSFAQEDTTLQLYFNSHFQILHPTSWGKQEKDNQITFLYNAAMGDITITVFKDQLMDDDSLRTAVLRLNDQKDPKPDTAFVSNSSFTLFRYYYSNNGVKYFVKVIRFQNMLYVVSLNWNEDTWPLVKDQLMKCFDSFSFRKS